MPSRELLLLSALGLAACAPGFVVNGRHVSDAELAQHRAAWQPGALELAAKSAIAVKEHEGILNLIAAMESRGATRQPPCRDLTLTDIVAGTGTHLVFKTGERFGPLSLYEDWRVLACGNKHSWMALVGPAPRSQLQVVFAPATHGDWLRVSLPTSQGTYRLPYAEGTLVKVFDDFSTHRPKAALDLFAVDGPKPYRIVAAAAGRIMAIQDGYEEQQSGRSAAECRNNYVWIAHANGEWTSYSHLARDSVTNGAKLKVGDEVAAGTHLGDEAAVGCAMLSHLHFEVAVPNANAAIDAGGFLLDNENSRRARNPRFCTVSGPLIKDKTYNASACK